LFPFTFFVSEDAAIIGVIVFALLAGLLSGQHSNFIHNVLMAAVGSALLGWSMLLVSGVLGPSQGPLNTVHNLAGHLLFPVVACATGMWLGTAFPNVVRHPLRFLVRLGILLILCLGCFSNARTGYLGPSRVDTLIHPDTRIRFKVFHQVFFPAYIGLVLAIWFRRLLVARTARSARKQPV
jgi:hypothetical protein